MLLLFIASLLVFLTLHDASKKVFSVNRDGEQGPPSPSVATALNLPSDKTIGGHKSVNR